MKTYNGSCHCSAVTFEITADIPSAISCNCSFCSMKAPLLAAAPASAFTLKQGEDSLTTYKFNKHAINHRFCKVCGVQVYSHATGPDGTAMVMVNLRAIPELDLGTVQIIPFDGKSR